MNFWKFLDKQIGRLPGWPNERQVVMFMTYALAVTMLVMARNDPQLWTIELFKTLITVIMVTGFVNLILAFYFSANKSDEIKTENSGKFADAMKEQAITARANIGDDALRSGDTVTLQQEIPSDGNT